MSVDRMRSRVRYSPYSITSDGDDVAHHRRCVTFWGPGPCSRRRRSGVDTWTGKTTVVPKTLVSQTSVHVFVVLRLLVPSRLCWTSLRSCLSFSCAVEVLRPKLVNRYDPCPLQEIYWPVRGPLICLRTGTRPETTSYQIEDNPDHGPMNGIRLEFSRLEGMKQDLSPFTLERSCHYPFPSYTRLMYLGHINHTLNLP